MSPLRRVEWEPITEKILSWCEQFSFQVNVAQTKEKSPLSLHHVWWKMSKRENTLLLLFGCLGHFCLKVWIALFLKSIQVQEILSALHLSAKRDGIKKCFYCWRNSELKCHLIWTEVQKVPTWPPQNQLCFFVYWFQPISLNYKESFVSFESFRAEPLFKNCNQINLKPLQGSHSPLAFEHQYDGIYQSFNQLFNEVEEQIPERQHDTWGLHTFLCAWWFFSGHSARWDGRSGSGPGLVLAKQLGREERVRTDSAVRHRGAMHNVCCSAAPPQYPHLTSLLVCVCVLGFSCCSFTSCQTSPWSCMAAGTSVSEAAAQSWMSPLQTCLTLGPSSRSVFAPGVFLDSACMFVE